jgi:predicted DNA-binding transcriptional regulator YafY
MYSPTSRLLTVLEMLQSYKQLSGAEMARRLEVDRRTVRRYIVMLQDMGIPVEAERGPYGAYQLQRGYKMPPLLFTDAEAVALSLALLAIRELKFPVEIAAVEGALAKTERVMPEKLLQQARALQEAITFNVTPPPALRETGLLTNLSSAIQQRQQVRLRYKSFQGTESERDYDPYGIVFNEGFWYTAGYCHLRGDLRTFRLDRVMTLETGQRRFERPEGFDTLAHVLDSLITGTGQEQVEVLLKTTLEHARAMIEPALGQLEETEDGIVLRRAATQLEWITHFLLHLDCPVVIKKPRALRDRMKLIAERAAGMVESTSPSNPLPLSYSEKHRMGEGELK